MLGYNGDMTSIAAFGEGQCDVKTDDASAVNSSCQLHVAVNRLIHYLTSHSS